MRIVKDEQMGKVVKVGAQTVGVVSKFDINHSMYQTDLVIQITMLADVKYADLWVDTPPPPGEEAAAVEGRESRAGEAGSRSRCSRRGEIQGGCSLTGRTTKAQRTQENITTMTNRLETLHDGLFVQIPVRMPDSVTIIGGMTFLVNVWNSKGEVKVHPKDIHPEDSRVLQQVKEEYWRQRVHDYVVDYPETVLKEAGFLLGQPMDACQNIDTRELVRTLSASVAELEKQLEVAAAERRQLLTKNEELGKQLASQKPVDMTRMLYTLAELSNYWIARPHLRLGQLVVNSAIALRQYEPEYASELFNLSDAQFVTGLGRLRENESQGQATTKG